MMVLLALDPIHQHLAVLRADQLSCSALQARRTPFIEVPKMSKIATYGRRDPCFFAVISTVGRLMFKRESTI